MNTILSEILLYLSGFSQFLHKYTGDISFPKLHYSWLIVLFLVFAIFLIGLNLGKSRMLISLLSLYAAAFLEAHFIYFNGLHKFFPKISNFWLHAGLFLILYFIFLAVLNRSILKRGLTLKESSLISVSFLAIAEIGFLTSILLAYLPAEMMNALPESLTRYFGTKNAQFWWAILPLIVAIFLKRGKTIADA